VDEDVDASESCGGFVRDPERVIGSTDIADDRMRPPAVFADQRERAFERRRRSAHEGDFVPDTGSSVGEGAAEAAAATSDEDA
jgi:hypothetical protein